MDWNSFVYFPVLKTKDAELRAIGSVDLFYRQKMLPIYEITKSRITKKNSLGDIVKRLEQIRQIQGELPFVLDVTTDEKQINDQIRNILSPVNGYECWREWLGVNANSNLVPMIHINFEDDEDLGEAKKFVSCVDGKYHRLALRLPVGLKEGEYEEIIVAITSELKASKLFVLLDGGCIRSLAKAASVEMVAKLYQQAFYEIISSASQGDWLERVVCIAGSFPQNVSLEGGGDEHGSFKIFEQSLFVLLRHNRPLLQFGDYASINVNQIEMRGGTFVPRIDYCDDTTFYYYRKRRDEGSYVWCAKQVVADSAYSSLGSWADDEIISASLEQPSGISPSFWISVRACNYMIRRVNVLSA